MLPREPIDFIDLILTGNLGPLVEILSVEHSLDFKPIAVELPRKKNHVTYRGPIFASPMQFEGKLTKEIKKNYPNITDEHFRTIIEYFALHIRSILSAIFDSSSEKLRLNESIYNRFKSCNIDGALVYFSKQQVHFHLVAAALSLLATKQTSTLATEIIEGHSNQLLELSNALHHLKKMILHNRPFHLHSPQQSLLERLVVRLQIQANAVMLFHEPSTAFIRLVTEMTELLSIASVPQLSPALFELSTIKVKNILTALESGKSVETISEVQQDMAQPVANALMGLHRLIAARPFQDRELKPYESAHVAPETMDHFNTARNQMYYQGVKLLNQLYDQRKPTVDASEDYEIISEVLAHSTAYFKNPFLANQKTFRDGLLFSINQVHGKPDHWQQFLGGVLMLTGTVFMGLSIAALVWSGGTSILGIKAGYTLTIAGLSLLGGLGLFKSGQQQPASLSGTASDLVKCGKKITSKL